MLAYFGTLAGPHCAVVECVQSWYWLRDLLGPTGVDLRLAHAKHVKAISYAKVKTDRVDARMLAQLLRAGLVREAHMIGAELRETRDPLRSRLQLVTRAVRCRHAGGSLLEKYNVPTPEELPELARMQAALQEEQRVLIRTHVRRVEAVPLPLVLSFGPGGRQLGGEGAAQAVAGREPQSQAGLPHRSDPGGAVPSRTAPAIETRWAAAEQDDEPRSTRPITQSTARGAIHPLRQTSLVAVGLRCIGASCRGSGAQCGPE